MTRPAATRYPAVRADPPRARFRWACRGVGVYLVLLLRVPQCVPVGRAPAPDDVALALRRPRAARPAHVGIQRRMRARVRRLRARVRSRAQTYVETRPQVLFLRAALVAAHRLHAALPDEPRRAARLFSTARALATSEGREGRGEEGRGGGERRRERRGTHLPALLLKAAQLRVAVDGGDMRAVAQRRRHVEHGQTVD